MDNRFSFSLMKTSYLVLSLAFASILGIQGQVAGAAPLPTHLGCNIAGYYNVTVPAGCYTILGNQLINGSDANGTNNDIDACLSAGFISDISDPNGPPGSSNTVYNQWLGSYREF